MLHPESVKLIVFAVRTSVFSNFFIFNYCSSRVELFKKHCTSFFIDVVTEFCFTKELLLTNDNEVITRIMSYAFSSEGTGTKQFSPLQDDIDRSPVIRSFILQQLLNALVLTTVFLFFLKTSIIS